MERLTYKEGNHYYSENDCLVEINTIDEDSLNVLQNVLDKLGAYEDAEEQGRILPAPLDGVERFTLDGGKTTWQRVYEPDMTEGGAVVMNENEAIEVLKDFDKQVTAKADGAYQTDVGKMACDTAIKALEEVQRYRKIGTVEECRAAREKQTAKRPDYEGDGYDYCPNCGQKIRLE